MLGSQTIVALVGPKRVGKDTIASWLLRLAPDILNPYKLNPQASSGHVLTAQGSFAERLREAASACYGLDGRKDKHGAPGLFWCDAFKETPQEALNGRTPREVLIHLGASMRGLDHELWCRGGFEDLAHKLRCHNPQLLARLGVLTDMRFANEMHFGKAWCAVRGWNLITVGVHREQAPAPGHDSADQEAVALRARCDLRFDNSGDMDDLVEQARSLLIDIAHGRR